MNPIKRKLIFPANRREAIAVFIYFKLFNKKKFEHNLNVKSKKFNNINLPTIKKNRVKEQLLTQKYK